MERSEKGIWMAELDPPLSRNRTPEEQLQHLFLHALLKRCNQAFAQIYGFGSPAKLLGTPILRFIAPDDPQNIHVLWRFLHPPHIVREAEMHEEDKQGNRRWFLNDAWGIVEDDHLVRAWGRQWEITVRKQTQLERSELSMTLPPRQKTVLHLLGEGHTVKEIAGVMKISQKTVHNHRERLMKRLGIGDVVELIHYAHRLGIAHRVGDAG